MAFYLYALGSSTIFNATIVLGLCGLVFVPVGYVYPSRTPVLKQVTVSLGVVWAGLTLAAIGQLPDTSLGLVWVSLLFPVYYFTLSLCLHVRRASRVASGASTKHD